MSDPHFFDFFLEVHRRIRLETPESLGLPFALWTRQAVRVRVRVRVRVALETGESMPIRTVGLYLKRWGFTPQKPLRRAYE